VDLTIDQLPLSESTSRMILSGWKEIASYLHCGVRTVQRWEMDGLPIRRPLPGKRRELEHEMQSPVAAASPQSSHSPDNSVPHPFTDKTKKQISEAA